MNGLLSLSPPKLCHGSVLEGSDSVMRVKAKVEHSVIVTWAWRPRTTHPHTHTCKEITDFVWKNKCHYMKRSVILNSYNKGGLNVIDFNSLNYSLKINWLNKYLKNQHSIWYIFPQQAFSFVGGITFLLMCNYNISKLPVKLSKFRQQVLLAWVLIYKPNFTPHTFFIWSNQNILYKNRSLFFNQWFNNGLFLVSQLFNSRGLLMTSIEFISEYNIPVSPREFAIVMGAITSGIRLLFKNRNYSPLKKLIFLNQ